MSSGSYFTIYRKHKNIKASDECLAMLKNEYFLSNENNVFTDKKTEKEMKEDIPLFMHSTYKADSHDDDENSDIYYDSEGIEHIRLLDFHFSSDFRCLKEHFNLNPYSFKNNSVIISKDEAKKMLQAIKYILAEEYSKKIEDVLDNEYINLFGQDYSFFNDRFNSAQKPIYIDKENDSSWKISYGDYGFEKEIEESDSCASSALKRAKICLEVFVEAENYSWDNEELVLEYYVY